MAHPAKNRDLHGSAPDDSPVALILLDVISDFEFPQGDQLRACAGQIVPRIQALKQQAKRLKIPVIYVNDNFGRWQSDFRKLVDHCLEPVSGGREFVQALAPEADDYFVLKPKHSGFYGTTLELLLHYLNVDTLVLTGLTGDMCVLFTAQDAYLRDLHLFVPSDCVASCDPRHNDYAMAHIERVLEGDIRPSSEIDLGSLRRRG